MNAYVKTCPSCETGRALEEVACKTVLPDESFCGFPLLDIPLTPVSKAGGLGERPQEPSTPEPPAPTKPPDPAPSGPRCSNGHAVEEDDRICLTCGAPLGDAPPPPTAEFPAIPGWQLFAQLPDPSNEADLFLARAEASTETVLFKLYQRGIEPDVRVYPALAHLDGTFASRLLAAERFEGRAFEVWEHLDGQTLAEVTDQTKADDALLPCIATQLIRAVAALEQAGLSWCPITWCMRLSCSERRCSGSDGGDRLSADVWIIAQAR